MLEKFLHCDNKVVEMRDLLNDAWGNTGRGRDEGVLVKYLKILNDRFSLARREETFLLWQRIFEVKLWGGKWIQTLTANNFFQNEWKENEKDSNVTDPFEFEDNWGWNGWAIQVTME